MYNKDLFEKLREEFGDENMPKFCEMVSEMYNILCENDDDYHCRKEYEFERDWWDEISKKLTH